MKILKQLAIYIALCIFGECVSAVLPFRFSASIISMVVLFILLLAGVLNEEELKETSDFMIRNLTLFLLPISVSIYEYRGLLMSLFVPLIVICTVSMILTFAATAFTVTLTSKIMSRRGGKI